MGLLRAGVDMLPGCPVVSLKEKNPVQNPPPPGCGSLITLTYLLTYLLTYFNFTGEEERGREK